MMMKTAMIVAVRIRYSQTLAVPDPRRVTDPSNDCKAPTTTGALRDDAGANGLCDRAEPYQRPAARTNASSKARELQPRLVKSVMLSNFNNVNNQQRQT